MIILLLLLSSSDLSLGVRGAFANDFLTFEHYDDNGFTNDLELRGFVRYKSHTVNIFLRHRMITSRKNLDKTRWDEGTARFQYLYTVYSSNSLQISFGPHFEIAAGGNLGGLAIQNFVHHITKSRTVENGKLQTDYPSRNVYGAVFGASLQATDNLSYGFSLRSNLVAQIAIGSTGFNKLLASLGFVWNLGSNFVFNPQLSFDFDISICDSIDNNLSIPGGYVTNEFVFTPKFEISIIGKYWSVGYGQRFNEGGSDHTIGILFVELKND